MSTVHNFKRFQESGKSPRTRDKPKKLLDARNRRAHRQHCIKTGIILSQKSLSVNTVHRAIHKSKEEAMWARSRNSSLGLSSSKTYWGKVENWSQVRRIGNWNSFWKLWRRDLVHLVDSNQSKSISDGVAAYIFRKTPSALKAPRIQYQTRPGHHSTQQR